MYIRLLVMLRFHGHCLGQLSWSIVLVNCLESIVLCLWDVSCGDGPLPIRGRCSWFRINWQNTQNMFKIPGWSPGMSLLYSSSLKVLIYVCNFHEIWFPILLLLNEFCCGPHERSLFIHWMSELSVKKKYIKKKYLCDSVAPNWLC